LTGLRVTAGMAFLGIVYSGIAPGFSSPGETMELIGGSALFNTSHPQPPPGGGLIWTLAAVAQERMPDPSPVGKPRDALGPVTPPSFSVIEIAPDGHIRFEGRGTPGTRVTLNRYGQPLASAMVSANGDWTVNLGQRFGSGVHEFSSLATKPNYGVPIAGSDVRIAIPSGFSAAGRNGEEAVPPADAGLAADMRSRAKDRARDAAEQFSQLQRPQLSQASPESRAKTDRADGTDKEPGKEGGWTFWLQDWLASSNRDFQGKIVRPLQLPKPDPADVEAADTQPAPTKDEVKQSEAAKNAEAKAKAKAEAEAAARGKAERIAAERATKAKAEAELLAAERRERAERRAAAAADAHDAKAARQAEAQRQAEEKSQRHAERKRQTEADQRAEARRTEAQRQQAAAEDARRQLEAQVQAEAEAEARQRERRLREELERALLAAEAEAKRRRAEVEAAAEASRRRATEQRIAAKTERARQLHEIARDDAARSAPAPTRPRETPRMGLRGGDVMPDDGAETSVRATDGYVMPEGWRRLAQRDGNSRSMPVSTSTRTTAGNPDRDARAPRMARRATDASCRRAGKRIRPPGTYVVRYGDSLWVISRRHYRKGKYWPVIYRANGAEIDDPDLIYPCQRLHLPKLGRGRR
jgi:colicin import membrane protein